MHGLSIESPSYCVYNRNVIYTNPVCAFTNGTMFPKAVKYRKLVP